MRITSCSCLGWGVTTGFRDKLEGVKGWKFCPYCGQELTAGIFEEGDYILYGSQYAEYRELLRRGLYLGILTVALDYNRSGWATSSPEDCVIFRVHTLPSDKRLCRVLSERPYEFVSGQELDRLQDMECPKEASDECCSENG